MKSATETEQTRLECEARYWLKYERYNKDNIEERLQSLARKRGAWPTKLHEEMRRQWKLRGTTTI